MIALFSGLWLLCAVLLAILVGRVIAAGKAERS